MIRAVIDGEVIKHEWCDIICECDVSSDARDQRAPRDPEWKSRRLHRESGNTWCVRALSGVLYVALALLAFFYGLRFATDVNIQCGLNIKRPVIVLTL